MSAIATYVFIDLETSGLPNQENNRTKITEISLVAVKRQHVLETRKGCAPRVQHKLTLCLNPRRMIQPDCTKVTGLCNDLLEHESSFNAEVYTLIKGFLDLLTKPVCLIAQNGHNFDFPILKNHFVKLGVSLTDDLMCADCLHGFYDIMEKQNIQNNTNISVIDLTQDEDTASIEKKTDIDRDEPDLFSENTLSAKAVNEMTPKRPVSTKCANAVPQKSKPALSISKARRRFPWSKGEKPTDKYKLGDVYSRLLNREAVDAHRAENDCLLALECSVALGKAFVEWIDENHCLFSKVKPMMVGVPLGSLLLLTGMLWGCTNPFIKQGTRGLRKVKADTRLGQAYAEVTFLLGNWRYVVPWLVNQAGSLVYVCAVRRAPLSLAAPAANALATACTALTGAACGYDQPLDPGSIFGIVLIGSGTVLCCWDKVAH